MFLHLSQEIRQDRQGFCMDFCPVCGEVTVFAVTDVYKVWHLYWVPIESGRRAVVEKICQVCHGQLLDDGHTPFHHDPLDTEALLARVPAATRATWPEKAAHAKRRRDAGDDLSYDERMQRIVELFRAMRPTMAETAARDMTPNWAMVRTFLVWSIVPLVILLLGPWIAEWSIIRRLCSTMGIDAFGLACFLVLGSGLVALLHLLFTSKSRLVRKHVFPRLVPVLRPLCPSHQELAEVRKALKRVRCMTGRFRVADLEAAIEAYRP